MFGYAPFLGQARLGQLESSSVLVQLFYKNGPPIANQWVNVVRSDFGGKRSGRTDSRGTAEIEMPLGTSRVKVAPEPLPGFQWDPIEIEDYLGRQFVFSAVPVAAPSTPAGTPAPAPDMQQGTPTWVWVLGGLAALGTIGWLATRK